MLKAYNQDLKLIHIIESNATDKFTCPVCKESLTRKFGSVKQYYAHPKGKGLDCELKLEIRLKEESIVIESERNDILESFYAKKFDDVKIDMSDYMGDEGYYLTQQQKDIILSTESRVVVSALAGASKSTTLYYYAKERPQQRFLYVVYNKSQQLEAEHTFGKLKNVEIKTVHGLAYKYVGKFYQSKLTFNYGVVDIIKDLRLDWNSDKQLASQIKEYMASYMLSSVETFQELGIYENMESHIRAKVITLCEKLWTMKKEYKSNVKVEHDFYLKLFQLGKIDMSVNYDGILLDECQDGNLLVLSLILESKVENIVMVGDMYQSLYRWRKSTNIMSLLEGATEYKLTTSFRISQNIAEVSNMLIQDMVGDSVGMTGFNTKQSIVTTVDRSKQHAILCRTNAMILGEVIENANKKIFYNGGFKGYNFNNVKDAYYFSRGKSTNNPLFVKFKSYIAMVDYAEEVTDLEILSLDRIIKRYGSDIPSIVDNLEKNVVADAKDCDIWISTIHKSKGSTIKMPLIISNDHYDLVKLDEDKLKDTAKDMLFENCCLIYVAITRAFGQIELSEKLKIWLESKL